MDGRRLTPRSSSFMMRLLARLQGVGTVTAIDNTVYSKISDR
jgi:hypothetical protein